LRDLVISEPRCYLLDAMRLFLRCEAISSTSELIFPKDPHWHETHSASKPSCRYRFSPLDRLSISSLVFRAASAARNARFRTSSATTANPAPASPARAASTAHSGPIGGLESNFIIVLMIFRLLTGARDLSDRLSQPAICAFACSTTTFAWPSSLGLFGIVRILFGHADISSKEDDVSSREDACVEALPPGAGSMSTPATRRTPPHRHYAQSLYDAVDRFDEAVGNRMPATNEKMP